MESFDKMLKEMAKKEEIIVPNGFDKRMKDVLDSLPAPVKKGRGAVKLTLIAVAACIALLGTAFAASPGLRELLAEALGSFAPYAQEQDSAVYTWNGFEFQVMAALADENTIRVYVQAVDTEGKHRLDVHGHSDAWMDGGPWLDIYVPHTSVRVTGGMGQTTFESYDAATQTAIAVVTIWGEITDDLTGAELRIDTPLNMMDAPGDAAVNIPLDIEILPSKTLFQDMEMDGIVAEEIWVSPLGITAIMKKEDIYTHGGLDVTFRIRMKDGMEIATEREGISGYGVFGDPEAGDEWLVPIWNFADPVDVDDIEGIYVGEDYFPIN